jgi:hypothetical protein
MTDTTLRDLLRASQALADILDDVHVRFVTLAPNGEWSFEKLGRHRRGETVLDADDVVEIAETLRDGANEPEGWSLRVFSGTSGPTILMERRPVAVVDRIPDEVLQTLKKRARRDGVVAIAGPPGSGKSNMLLWATRHLSDEMVVLVSENPPDELPGTNVVHVEPPRTPGEHRDLQRLLRRAPNVSWDRLSGLDDVNTLLGGAGSRRRTFTLDSSDTVSTLRRMQAWRDMGHDANLDVVLQLTTSVIGRAEVLDLLVFEDGEWQEVYSSSGSRLDAVKQLGRAAARKHAITQPGIEPDAPTGERPTPEASGRPQTPPEGKMAALRAGIRKRPGQPTQDFDAPHTIPISDDAAPAHEDTPVSAEEPPTESELPEVSGSATSRLDAETSSAVLDQFEGFEEEDPTSSGEIDLQGFIARREGTATGDSSGELLPEETRQYQVKVSGESDVRPDRIPGDGEESEPDEIIPGVDLNAGDTDSYNLENLKITRVEELEAAEMEELRAIRREQLAGDSASGVDLGDSADSSAASVEVAELEELEPAEIDDLPSVEIDEADLIVEGKEWSEAEENTSQTAVANADVYEAAAREITGRIDADVEDVDYDELDPDSATNPSISVDELPAFAADGDEDTAEFSLGDKIRLMRSRLKNEEK